MAKIQDSLADTGVLDAGAGITITQAAPGDPVIITGTAAYTDEQVRDVVGAALVAGSNVTITVNDGADTITVAATSGAATFVGCAAERTATQSMSHATWTAVQFSATDLYDTDSIHDPSTNNTRLTVPAGKGGKWMFVPTVDWAANANGVRAVGWKKNGTALADRYGFDYRRPSASYATVMGKPLVIELVAGDYIELQVYQESGGGALNVTTAHLAGHFLG